MSRNTVDYVDYIAENLSFVLLSFFLAITSGRYALLVITCLASILVWGICSCILNGQNVVVHVITLTTMEIVTTKTLLHRSTLRAGANVPGQAI